MKWYNYFFTIGGMIIITLGIGVGIFANYSTMSIFPDYSGLLGAGMTILFILVAMVSYVRTARKHHDKLSDK